MRESFLAQIVLVTAGLLAAAFSQAQSSDEDPPDRVARVSYIKGRIDLQTRDDADWVEATINRPLTGGGRVRVGNNARGELQIGAINLQLDERADLAFLELSDSVAQAQLTEGAAYVQVRRLRGDEVVEIDTPHAAVAITQPGHYSIALVDGRTRVRTFDGECEVTDQGRTIKLHNREQAIVGGVNPRVESIAGRSAFESWARDRNERLERSASARYVDPDVIGYADLDDYGEWVHEVDYGHVWYPRHVVSDWAPYRFGRWVWVSPWGWTWVDDAPWGFAPFHYGRWAHVRGRWCWVPGPLHVRPIYAPALVAWVGVAPPRTHVSVSIAFGSGIGWFPLAPREVYVPSYRCSRRHIHSVNYANTVIVNNVYINRAYSNPRTHFDYVHRNAREAVTVVHADAFRNARPVREHIVRVEQRELRNWSTHNAIPELRPEPRMRREQVNDSWRDDGGKRNIVMRHTPRNESFDGRQRERVENVEANTRERTNAFGREPVGQSQRVQARERTEFRGKPRERVEFRSEPRERIERAPRSLDVERARERAITPEVRSAPREWQMQREPSSSRETPSPRERSFSEDRMRERVVPMERREPRVQEFRREESPAPQSRGDVPRGADKRSEYRGFRDGERAEGRAR